MLRYFLLDSHGVMIPGLVQARRISATLDSVHRLPLQLFHLIAQLVSYPRETRTSPKAKYSIFCFQRAVPPNTKNRIPNTRSKNKRNLESSSPPRANPTGRAQRSIVYSFYLCSCHLRSCSKRASPTYLHNQMRKARSEPESGPKAPAYGSSSKRG